MRPLLPMMSQWIQHTWTLNNFERSFNRYGQIIIYLIAIGIIGFIYLGAQRAIATYLESLQAPLVPQF